MGFLLNFTPFLKREKFYKKIINDIQRDSNERKRKDNERREKLCFIISSNEMIFNRKLVIKLQESLLNTLVLVSNPSNPLSPQIAHHLKSSSLKDFNTNTNFKYSSGDLLSQFKIYSPRELTPRLFSCKGGKQNLLLCNFIKIHSPTPENNLYIYQGEYFNNPDSYDVYLNCSVHYSYLKIDIHDEDESDIKIEFIETFMSLSKRKILMDRTCLFQYPEKKIITYEWGEISLKYV